MGSATMTVTLRPEESLHLQQLRKLGQVIRHNVANTTTKDAMFGGIATWNRENNSFQIHKSGVTSEGNLKHIEVDCLDTVDELMRKKVLMYDNLLYLYLNKAPCADYNGNRKNCLDKVIKWARNNPTKKLIMGFKKPYAIGSFKERGSWHRPDKDIWPLYKMNLMCRDLPHNLVIFSFVKNGQGQCPEIFQNKNESFTEQKSAWITRKVSKGEEKIKVKLLKNQKANILEFDKEKHLIKSFMLANRKQGKEIERDRKIIFGNSSRESSNNSKRSYKIQSQLSNGKSKSMVPIEVS